MLELIAMGAISQKGNDVFCLVKNPQGEMGELLESFTDKFISSSGKSTKKNFFGADK